jgi:hypothetical protein
MLAPAIDTGRSQPFGEACTDSSVIANRNAHNTGGGVLLLAQVFSKQLQTEAGWQSSSTSHHTSTEGRGHQTTAMWELESPCKIKARFLPSICVVHPYPQLICAHSPPARADTTAA